MPSSQLWAPKPQRIAQHPAATLELPNMIPGMWLQLSPVTSPSCNPNKYLQLTPSTSPLPSPSLKAEGVSPVDLADLSLADKNEKYLTNASRQSSVSSSSSTSRPVSTKAPAFLTAPSVERREMAVGRLGGLGAAFLSN